MKKILNEMKLKGGSLIESLTAQEARQQPTPVDAVKSIMTDKDKKKAQEGFVKIEDKMVKGAVGEIAARFYIPEGKGSLAVRGKRFGGKDETARCSSKL